MTTRHWWVRQYRIAHRAAHGPRPSDTATSVTALALRRLGLRVRGAPNHASDLGRLIPIRRVTP